jgi:hypothetical protein
MATFASYHTFSTGPITLDEATGHRGDQLQFVLRDVDISKRAVLAFRVDPEPPITLRIGLNSDADVVRQPFNTSAQRSWHEIVEENVLVPGENQLFVSVEVNPDLQNRGKAVVSDLVLFYQATAP